MPAQKTAKLLPAYLIVGTDELKRKEALKRLRGRLDEGFSTFNLDERSGSAVAEPGDLITSLNTLPIGDSFRLVIVEHAEKLPKSVSEALVAYLKSPNEECVLCLVAEKLAKNTRLYKAIAGVGPRTVIDCTPKKRWELAPSVIKMAARYGMGMDSTAADELISRVGESTTLLDAQVKVLSGYCQEAGHITCADVENHITRTADVKPWDLLDALCERNARKALSLYRLMLKPSQIALLSFLVGRIRELICAKSLDARGEGASLASALGRQSWQVKNYGRWARAFAPGELERLLARCAKAERAMKTGADQDIVFVGLMLEVCK